MPRLKAAFRLSIFCIWMHGSAAAAQTAEQSCELGNATAIVEGADVRAQVFSTGFLFSNASYAPDELSRYAVPKGSDLPLIWGAGLWLSGTIDDTLRSSVGFYGHQSFWPGPLDDSGEPVTDCSPFNRVWSVSREDLRGLAETGIASKDLGDWPTGLGAPTLDANGQRIVLPEMPLAERLTRVIDIEAGERPYVRGSETHWWIINDVAKPRDGQEGPPLGIEVGVTAFAFDSPGVVGRSTFFEFSLRKPEGPALEDFYVGTYTDVDLWQFDDDFMGSDSSLGLAYVYNSQPEDPANPAATPPAVGIDFLRGPWAADDEKDNDGDGAVDEVDERMPMQSAVAPTDTRAWPINVRQYFTGIGRWSGQPMVAYGNGWPENAPQAPQTNWHYGGEPGQFWSEIDIDGGGTASVAGDRRIVAGAGPVRIGPGRPQQFLVAYLTSYGSDHLDSVRQLKEDDRFLQRLADDGILDPAPDQPAPAPEPLQDGIAASFFPVPAGDRVAFRFRLPEAEEVRLELFDLRGRQIGGHAVRAEPGTHDLVMDVADQAPGVYLARISIGERTYTRTLVVAR